MGARPSSFTKDTQERLLAQGETNLDHEHRHARVWSPEQTEIFTWFEQKAQYTDLTYLPEDNSNARNLVVDAVAGSGKTTTIVEAVQRAPEENVLVCAFNKRIAQELSDRFTHSLVTAKTLHGIGYQIIRRHWKGMPCTEENTRADQLTRIALGQRVTEVPKRIASLVSKLHTKAREMAPTNWHEPGVLEDIALRFDCEPDEGWSYTENGVRKEYNLPWLVETTERALAHAMTERPDRKIGIDYADMIALPLMHHLTSRDYDLVAVDEAQDMTVAQLELAQRVCHGRFCIIGDRHQAIYGFRGADSGSLDRLKAELNAVELPLTTTYRCGWKIVERAQKLVPHIRAVESAEPGEVVSAHYDDLMKNVSAGDVILSRLNAPLVSVTLALLRQGKRARMAGKIDIGKQVMTVIRSLRAGSLDDLIVLLEKWEERTVNKYAQYGKLDLVDRTRDMADMIRAFILDAESMSQLQDKIEYLFVDVPEEDQILASSVHKAKGLEWDRVWLMQESLYRRGDNPEERNIEYVAITRAKSSLYIVEGVPSLRRREEF